MTSAAELSTMRTLTFAPIKRGDQAAGDPHTLEGAAAIMRQVCPELTDAEAAAAAKEGARRAVDLDVEPIKALLRDLFEH